jgi:hypothetical protein
MSPLGGLYQKVVNNLLFQSKYGDYMPGRNFSDKIIVIILLQNFDMVDEDLKDNVQLTETEEMLKNKIYFKNEKSKIRLIRIILDCLLMLMHFSDSFESTY